MVAQHGAQGTRNTRDWRINCKMMEMYVLLLALGHRQTQTLNEKKPRNIHTNENLNELKETIHCFLRVRQSLMKATLHVSPVAVFFFTSLIETF